jgi:hypothetical protein
LSMTWLEAALKVLQDRGPMTAREIVA